MSNSVRVVFLLLFIFGVQLTSSAEDEQSKFKKLSKGADVILTGKVSHKKSNWNANKTRIYTKTTVEVDEYLKGKNNHKSVEITTPGGEVGDIGEVYTHMPTFEENEEVLVFLKKDQKDESYQVFSGEEGKIKVHKDAITKEKVTNKDMRFKDLKSQIKSYLKEE